MERKFVKTMAMCVVATVGSAINIAGYNPIAIGIYSAVAVSRLYKWMIFLCMSIGFLYTVDMIDAVKYIIVMAAISTLVYIAKDEKMKKNNLMAATTGATLYGVMEMADKIMSGNRDTDYGILSLAAVLAFSVSIVVSRVIQWMEISEKRIGKKRSDVSEKIERGERIFEEKVKLIASSFDKLSKSIVCMNENRDGERQCYMGEMALSNIELVNEIWKGRMVESRNAIAMQLREMAGILKELATSTYTFAYTSYERESLLRLKLKNMGLCVRKIVMLNNRRGIHEVNITLKSSRRQNVQIRKMEQAISDSLGKRYKVAKDMGTFVRKEYSTYCFVEEPNYFLLYGVAKKGKSDLSGDNFSVFTLKSGQTIVTLSDGMGHGTKAYKESEMVLSLLEELMEGGFSEEASLRLINTVFLVDDEEVNPASVDMGIIDMYSGMCDFMKIGAATTFIKRGNWIEAIKSKSMPIGACSNLDMETTTKKLYDGDFVVMMSDGLLDSIKVEDKDDYMSKILMEIKSTNPTEMANIIMEKVAKDKNFEARDDMMVMVTGIWDKCA